MRVTAIRTLKPNVTQEEAVRGFRSGVFSGVYWRVRSGPSAANCRCLRAVLGLSCSLRNRPGAENALFCSRRGAWRARSIRVSACAAERTNCSTIQTRNQLVAGLQPEAAEELLRMKVLRVLFQQGFFKLRALKVEIDPHARRTASPVLAGLLRNQCCGKMQSNGRRAPPHRGR